MLKNLNIKKIKLIGLVCCTPMLLFSQKQFDVSKIPATLKTKADAVIRLDETIFTIENIGHATERKRWVVTIFNERGEKMHADFAEGYDKLRRIKNIEGVEYDASGKEIAKLKNSDIRDIGLSAFGNDFFDNRLKVAGFDKKKSIFPYTIEYSYEMQTENMMFYPEFDPLEKEFTAVEDASLTIITSDNVSFRYKTLNGMEKPVITEQGSKKFHTWHVKNLPAYEAEPNAPEFDQPFVITAPVEFEVEGYHGNIQTWADVGKFCFELNRGRDLLPETTKATVKKLIENEKDTKKKIENLYNYLQSTTHYMNISLGIGGWQNMEATAVAKNGYGDCKALSNYMKALLNEAGIPAYQALIYAGNDFSYNYSDFPCMHFNHVITCVPLEKDTLFLECTSQTNAMGYQGRFTGSRNALLILPDGGKLIKTSVYKPNDNAQRRTGKITIDANGDAQAIIATTYTGLQQEKRNGVMNNLNKEEQKTWMIDHIEIPSFELQKYSLSEKKTRLPEVQEKLKLTIKKMITQSGTRLFLTPNLMTSFLKIPFTEEERKSDLFLSPNWYDFYDTDTLTYELPEDYVLEFLPEPVTISSKFGEYTSKVVMKDGKLMYYRSATTKSGTYPKTDFKEWADFIKKASKNDKATVVFTRKKT
jgi:transglutaminase-like putative cysteine protease